jgi:hypothetical protein
MVHMSTQLEKSVVPLKIYLQQHLYRLDMTIPDKQKFRHFTLLMHHKSDGVKEWDVGLLEEIVLDEEEEQVEVKSVEAGGVDEAADADMEVEVKITDDTLLLKSELEKKANLQQ